MAWKRARLQVPGDGESPRAVEIEALVLDLDGVVTRTASVHAAAWKETFDELLARLAARAGGEAAPAALRPFTDADYRASVDGKPRLDGIRSFLASRGIALPEGTPADPPEADTVAGIAKRKNARFRALLAERGAEVFEPAVAFIRRARALGLGTAVVTSSRNGPLVLEAARIADLFDVRLDGDDLARLGLAGKPAPDSFLEAARRLGVPPARAAAFEDAAAGVAAERAAGFGLVVGVAPDDAPAAPLAAAGADVVIRDFRELSLDPAEPLAPRPSGELPPALAAMGEIAHEAAGKRIAVFLDYDGTLTPIVPRPEDALLSEAARAAVCDLARAAPVAVVSGRLREDVERLVGLRSLAYAGSHGWDVALPGGRRTEHPRAALYAPEIAAAARELAAALAGVEGAIVEDKRYALSVHYRLVPPALLPAVEAALDAALARHPTLRKTHGKKVFELRPADPWDKGKAVLWLLEALRLGPPAQVLAIYVGDDATDEDAFRALRETGAGFGVRVAGEAPGPTFARYSLASPAETGTFLRRVAEIARRAGGEATESAAGWSLVYEGFDPAKEGLREALCTLGNGRFATRGAAPWAAAGGVHYPGTYLAGGYDRQTTVIAGRPVENEDLVNLPDWLALSFRIAGEPWFDLGRVDILSYRQELDLRRGVLHRTVRVRDACGRETEVRERRLVHMADPHLAALELTFCAINWSGRLELRSALDGRVENAGVARYRDLARRHLEPIGAEAADGAEALFLEVRTLQSHLHIALAARTRVFRGGTVVSGAERRAVEEPGYAAHELAVAVAPGEAVSVEKVVALYTSRDRAISECGLAAREAIGRAPGLDELLRSHAAAWERCWRRFDIGIDIDGEGTAGRTAMILRLHIFHLLATVSPHTLDLDAGVPARGLHGEAYRGHVFWDELFVFPLLDLRMPEVTRALLLYRRRRLGAARAAARAAGYRGAMFPWQSGSDGREETQRLHLNPRSGRWVADRSHLQRHVNAAIAHNVWKYYEVTGDLGFLAAVGAEIILEIARFFASLATRSPERDRYEIRAVMGPDEFHDGYPDREEGGVDDNTYTNVMATWVLCRALDVLERLPEDARAELGLALALGDEEVARWREISRKMRVVFHADGVPSQFDGYERLLELDWDRYRAKYGDIQRLDRILEAEGDTANRYKVSKQADVLMLLYLFSADELRELFGRLGYEFPPEAIPRTVEYYVRRTSHGSTLSRVVGAWVLARSDRARSFELFREALESDISDVQGGTTAEGIHLGAMAGTVDLIQRCYTGLEVRGDVLWLDPKLPAPIARLDLRLRYRDQPLEIRVTRDRLRIASSPSGAGPIRVGFRGKVFELAPCETKELDLAPPAGAPSGASRRASGA